MPNDLVRVNMLFQEAREAGVSIEVIYVLLLALDSLSCEFSYMIADTGLGYVVACHCMRTRTLKQSSLNKFSPSHLDIKNQFNREYVKHSKRPYGI